MTAPRVTTPTLRHAARFAAWVRAWRSGLVPYDDVADEVSAGAEHVAADLPGTWTDVPLGEAIATLAKVHPDDVRLILPAPGDPRGLPGPGPFTSAALVAGEGVLAGAIGFVPEIREHTSGSGDTWESVCWRAYDLPAERSLAPELLTAAEAEADLAEALRNATTQLVALDVARWQPELAGALASLRRADSLDELPPGYDPRARRLYVRASVLDRVLKLAEHSAPGGAVNAFEAQRRSDVLRPLATACRRALMAACNAPLT